MNRTITRRDLLRRGALAGSALWLYGSTVRQAGAAPSDKLNIACIGIGGRGAANVNGVKGENIVALCDVDDKRAGGVYKKFPWAKKYYDYRTMLDEMSRQIDAVVISTPDHTHFHPAMMALNLQKHLYCEKPMGHSAAEVRTMCVAATKNKVQTQLGVQRHTLANMHRVVEVIKSGGIGEVRECHSWVGGNRGMPGMPKEFPAVPAHLKWDLWLGPAKDRKYTPAYCPYNWRFWWDFGTGETGNWGCHILDIPYWALDLKYPVKVSASGPEVDPQRTPKSMETCLEYPARGSLPAVKLYWSHTTSPKILQAHNLSAKGFGSGSLFIGSKGMLLTSFSGHKLYPEEQFKDYKRPDKFIPDSPGFYREWIMACKGGKPATCNFDYSGPMAEAVILANTAYQAGTGFEWDAKTLTAKGGGDKVKQLIYPTYRKGWEMKHV